MSMFVISIIIGLILLVWSADKFVDGSSNVAKHYGMSPLLIGMLIIGFGTSTPELVVSALSSYQGNPGIALGNAYGSNITNIGLILGITAILLPISVHSQVLKRELPILSFITILTIILSYDLEISRLDAAILIVAFCVLMSWTIREGVKNRQDEFGKEVELELKEENISIKKSFILLLGGLIVLILSSRLLVYGAVGIATLLGVSDIVIGLTVVAIGTSLPELASSIIAARKGEPDIALGNVLGSNLFNTLAVVGISSTIHPTNLDKEIYYRDIGTMTILTLSLLVFGYGFGRQGIINRIEGCILLIAYISYSAYLIVGTLH